MILRVKNWSSYQSYKDRKPPWIRFHKSILDDYKFHSMSANARAILPMLWLLASEDEDPVSGLLRDSYEEISFRLRSKKSDIEAAIRECIKSGFLEDINEQTQQVTNPLHNRNQTVTSETETETETETERAKAPVLHSTLPKEEWDQWLAKRRTKRWPTDTVTLSKQLKILAKFDTVTQKEIIDTSINAGWQGLFEPKGKPKMNGTRHGEFPS